MLGGNRRARTSRAAALALLCAGSAACTTPLRSNLSEQDADALVLALDDAAIAASKEHSASTGRYEVRVSELEATQALRVLRTLGKLETPQAAFDELYGEPRLVPTPGEERGRLAQARAGELARTIERMPNVTRARVHIADPQTITPLDAKPPALGASLLVERRAGTPVIDEASLRALLHGALGELDPNQVRIVQTEAVARAARSMARIGPFSVAASSGPPLKLAFGIALALNALLALAVIALVARRRRGAALPEGR